MVVVGEATEHVMNEGRRTLMAEDILWALRELGACPRARAPARPARLFLPPARGPAARARRPDIGSVPRQPGLEVYTLSLETLLDKLRAQKQPGSEGAADALGRREPRPTAVAGAGDQASARAFMSAS